MGQHSFSDAREADSVCRPASAPAAFPVSLPLCAVSPFLSLPSRPKTETERGHDCCHDVLFPLRNRYKCSIRTEPARAAALTCLGFGDEPVVQPRVSSTTATAAAAADTSAADKAALVQCQAELSACREELSKEKAENLSLKAALEEASAKVATLEAAQAAAKAKVEAAAKDFGALGSSACLPPLHSKSSSRLPSSHALAVCTGFLILSRAPIRVRREQISRTLTTFHHSTNHPSISTAGSHDVNVRATMDTRRLLGALRHVERRLWHECTDNAAP